jgi:hypothetical protein
MLPCFCQIGRRLSSNVPLLVSLPSLRHLSVQSRTMLALARIQIRLAAFRLPVFQALSGVAPLAFSSAKNSLLRPPHPAPRDLHLRRSLQAEARLRVHRLRPVVLLPTRRTCRLLPGDSSPVEHGYPCGSRPARFH